uniref:Uncharacterized protein n=1 Tax=viral metagenome TaxID=1070528 RepID=A0A6H1ZS77_9ZZZZ
MKVYVTFGQTHTHSINGKTLDKDCVAVIEAKDYETGRELAFKWFKGIFCSLYSEDDFDMDMMKWYPCGFISVK